MPSPRGANGLDVPCASSDHRRMDDPGDADRQADRTVGALERTDVGVTHDPPTLDEETLDAPVERRGDPRTAGAAPATRYLQEALLGAGSMGEVHLCRDGRIGRRIAFKKMQESVASDPALRSRFIREACVQGQLEHPAIVPVYDFARDERGEEYFTMRAVEGKSLRDVLQALRRGESAFNERYGQRKLLAAFATVSLAVSYAHSRGVIHRDIKPSNIMLGDFGEVYLLDWGVARVVEAPAAGGTTGARTTSDPDASTQPPVTVNDASDPTEVGATIGTIGYMPPEQLLGRAADERSDVYALGVVLFEILTTRRLTSPERSEAVDQTLRGLDVRAAFRSATAGVPPELEDLCVRATSREPRERPSSARELHDTVERYLDGDRDVQRRRELARDHGEAAIREAQTAAAGGVGAAAARERAFLELNRALALDQESGQAVAALRMLALPTVDDVAEETARELDASVAAVRRSLSRGGAATMAFWIGMLAWIVALGVRAWPFMAAHGAVIAVLMVLFLVRTRGQPRPVLDLVLVACLHVAVALVSGLAGPLTILPVILAATASASVLGARPAAWARHSRARLLFVRTLIVSLPLLAFAVPVLLELLGVVPASMTVSDGRIVILPRVMRFDGRAALVFLGVANLAPIIISLRLASTVRDQAIDVERRATEAARQLRQLLPRHAREAVMPSRPEIDDRPATP